MIALGCAFKDISGTIPPTLWKYAGGKVPLIENAMIRVEMVLELRTVKVVCI